MLTILSDSKLLCTAVVFGKARFMAFLQIAAIGISFALIAL